MIGRGEKDAKGGILLSVTAGDVIVIPAGTTHSCLESKDGYRYIGIYPQVGVVVDLFFSVYPPPCLGPPNSSVAASAEVEEYVWEDAR